MTDLLWNKFTPKLRMIGPAPRGRDSSTWFTTLPGPTIYGGRRGMAQPRLGRGDKRGANRVAGFVLVCALTNVLCASHHVPSGTEVGVLILAMRDSLLLPVILWLVYVAFEPYLRRYAPGTLIAWSRLLEGRWRDPLVGGHLLAGVAIGLGVTFAVAQLRIFNPNADISLPVDASRSVQNRRFRGCFRSALTIGSG
jgi:hypothetical protein